MGYGNGGWGKPRWHCMCTVDFAAGAKGLKRAAKRGEGLLQLLWPFPIFWPAFFLVQYSSPDHQLQNNILSLLPWTASSAETDKCQNCVFPLKPYYKGSEHEDVEPCEFLLQACKMIHLNEYWTPWSPSVCLRGVAWKHCQFCSCCVCAGLRTTWFQQEASSRGSLAVGEGYCNLDQGMQLMQLVPQKAKGKEAL